MSDRKTGVYLCSGCGIGEAIDIGKLEGVATGEFKVPRCASHEFLCGDDGIATIRADLESGEVNQIVIAACSPRVNTDRFRLTGTDPVRANLREQVTWCHPAGDEDTQAKAEDNVRMGITQAMKSSPPEPYIEGEFNRRLLVVGGGVAGLSAAREASKAGYEVLLVERSDRLGGHASRWSKRMPHRPPYSEPQPNDMPDLIGAVEQDPRITVMTGTTVAKTSGGPGKFEVELANGGSTTGPEKIGAIVMATGWRPYDPGKLGHLGYGSSPDIVTNIEFEDMLAGGDLARKSDGKAPQAVAFIQCAGSRDPEHLPYCSSVCCGVSIKQALEIRERNPKAMVYVIYEELRTPGTAEEFYRTAQSAGVIFLKGKVKGVGADLTVTVDDALLGEEVPLGGLDMVVLATGMVPNATTDGSLLGEPDINPFAPVAVAGYAEAGEAAARDGEAPEPAAAEAAATEDAGEEEVPDGNNSILNLQYRQGPHLPNLADGFADSHFICFPYETRRSGIYTCGPVRRPMDMAEAAEDAAGAALKAIQAIEQVAQGGAVPPRAGDLSFPRIGLNACTKCRRCTVECPFGAIDEDEEGYPIVSPTRCRRCGTCMGACPVRTISFDNYSVEMINAMTKAVEIPDEFEEKPRVLVLACENDAYPALDMAGVNRHQYSPHARVVPVRCLGSVSIVMISDALSSGYDGVILMGCKSGDDYQCHFVKGSAIAKERMAKIGETLKSMMLEEDRVVTYEVSITDSARAPKLIDSFMEKIDEIGFNPFKGF